MARMRIKDGKGVHFEFDNGCTISIQFGPGNYGDNYNMPFSSGPDSCIEAGKKGSAEAEIAIWDKAGEWFSFDSDKFQADGSKVKGYVPINEVVDWINRVRAMGES